MKRLFSLTLLFAICVLVLAQNYNDNRRGLSNFIARMYQSEPFEGVRVVTDYEKSYLISVLSLDKSKYQSQSVINRVASVKAMSQASQYFNGSSITTEIIIRTTEHGNDKVDVEIIETIKENSAGYVKLMEQLATFDDNSGRQVFIYCKEISQGIE